VPLKFVIVPALEAITRPEHNLHEPCAPAILAHKQHGLAHFGSRERLCKRG